MSDAYIIRRGGGGEGFDPNGAVLKVVTSTNCTVLVTGTGYSKTHEPEDGFVEGTDANTAEHFFSIPSSAFGAFSVTVSKEYGGEAITNTGSITVDSASKVYELPITTPNILLNNVFGLQDGLTFSVNPGSCTYDSDYKTLFFATNSTGNIAYINALTSKTFDITKYTKLSIGLVPTTLSSGQSIVFSLLDKDNNVASEENYVAGSSNVELSISSESKAKSPFKIRLRSVYSGSSSLRATSFTVNLLAFS